MSKIFAVSTFIILALSAAGSSASPPRRTEPHTEAGVIAADDAWLSAERRGDVAGLDDILLPEYRDVGADGKVYVKADLLRSTANRPDKSNEPAAKVAADFRAAHPVVMKVAIVDNTAILTFHSVNPDEQADVRSTDVLIYRRNAWHGVYSQHAGKKS
ncbi:MAG: nuclear transport factor 2 family protein [Sphingomonas sp.]